MGSEIVPQALAIFAGGCFWSKEYFWRRVPGVISTRVGFTGGHTENPTYKDVCTKTTGHAEAVEVTYDPTQVTYSDLLHHFFSIHDATIDRTDRGGQYRSAIFHVDERQQQVAEAYIRDLREKGIAVHTQLEPAATFYLAEARHQQYCDARGLRPKLKS